MYVGHLQHPSYTMHCAGLLYFTQTGRMTIMFVYSTAQANNKHPQLKNSLREYNQGATVHRLLKIILKAILLWYEQIATLAPSLDQPKKEKTSQKTTEG